MPKVLTEEEILCFRNKMCDHALALFAKSGVEGISLRGLAANLSCSRTTPYRYFKNKADILAALRQREFSRIADTLELAIEQSQEPKEQLTSLCYSYLQFALNHPDSYRVMYTVSQPDSANYHELEAEISRSSAPIRNVVNRAIASGLIKGDPVNICYLLWSGLHGLISLYLSNMLGQKREIEVLASEMIDALIGSFCNSQTPDHVASI